TVAFPACPPACLPGNIGNPVKVGPDRPAGGGYAGDLVVAQRQWGPCSYNVVTQAIFQDAISCSECASGSGGRYKANQCDSHQGVSKVIVAPAGYILADNYLATVACNSGPTGQFYRIVNGVPLFSFGLDVNLNALYGFRGSL